MKLWIPFAAAAVSLLAIASFVGVDWDTPPIDTTQVGYRGSGMYVHRSEERESELQAANALPEPQYEPDPTGERASEIYENVQVLGDLSSDQFNQFMASITEWVSPEQGCEYCHNIENLASDEVYTKVVARRMIQMNQAINTDWTSHVKTTGVTCYTCHRGQPVPGNHWIVDPGNGLGKGMAGYTANQNMASQESGKTSLPHDSLEKFLLGDGNIRVTSNTALPAGDNPATIKETESTFSLMIHMSESLGVNCVTCHNSRSFNDWDQSPPQRVTAWHGIRMVREVNEAFLGSLAPVFPDNRKGPDGHPFMVGCSTCHNGVQKPLYGETMLKDYVDSLATKTQTAVPDYSTYERGVTEKLDPGMPSSSSSSSSSNQHAVGTSEFASTE